MNLPSLTVATDDLPRDLADLELAPIALQVDRRLEQLGQLSNRELVLEIAAGTDHDPVPGRCASLLLELLVRDLHLHAWSLTWCDRGLRLSHDRRELVLGLSPGLRDFIELCDGP